MKIRYSKLNGPAAMKVMFNGNEIFRVDPVVVGEQYVIDPPKETGTAQSFLLIGDKEIPGGMAIYWYPDLGGAAVCIKKADELFKSNKRWLARTQLLQAVKILEKLAPNSGDLAEAYLSLCWTNFPSKARKPTVRAKRHADAVSWYRKALELWERIGDTKNLGGNLTNFGALQRRLGDTDGALQSMLRGLEIERACTAPDAERVHAWTHPAALYVELGKLDDAEALIKDGLERNGADSPDCAYLYEIWSDVHNARAKTLREQAAALEAQAVALHEKAVAMQPADSCPIG